MRWRYLAVLPCAVFSHSLLASATVTRLPRADTSDFPYLTAVRHLEYGLDVDGKNTSFVRVCAGVALTQTQVVTSGACVLDPATSSPRYEDVGNLTAYPNPPSSFDSLPNSPKGGHPKTFDVVSNWHSIKDLVISTWSSSLQVDGLPEASTSTSTAYQSVKFTDPNTAKDNEELVYAGYSAPVARTNGRSTATFMSGSTAVLSDAECTQRAKLWEEPYTQRSSGPLICTSLKNFIDVCSSDVIPSLVLLRPVSKPASKLLVDKYTLSGMFLGAVCQNTSYTYFWSQPGFFSQQIANFIKVNQSTLVAPVPSADDNGDGGSGGSSKLTPAAIGGIASGSLAIILIASLLVLYTRRYKKENIRLNGEQAEAIKELGHQIALQSGTTDPTLASPMFAAPDVAAYQPIPVLYMPDMMGAASPIMMTASGGGAGSGGAAGGTIGSDQHHPVIGNEGNPVLAQQYTQQHTQQQQPVVAYVALVDAGMQYTTAYTESPYGNPRGSTSAYVHSPY
ncbi:hypothetical protein GQ42DRAFT_165860 [Ramicandelaber brevisporus]|nr:hypothetical protein GQ42DRAFT_165860 [Ramicandelaber brevisporus]